MSHQAVSRREFMAMGAASGAVLLVGGTRAGASVPPSSAPSSNALEPFSGEASISLLNVIVCAAPYIIAEKLFHDEFALDVTNTSFSGGTDTVRGILSGDGFGSPATVSTLLGYQGGADNLRIIGGGFNAPSVVFLTLPDSEITSFADLADTKISIGAIGAPTEYFARLAAEAGGFEPGSDVEIVPVGGTAEQLTALEQGIVDVITTVAPVSTRLLAEGTVAQPFTGADLIPSWADVCMVATTQAIESDRQGLVQWLGAIDAALHLIVDDVDQAAEIWGTAIELDVDVARATLTDVPAEAWTIDIPDEAVQANIDAVIELGTGSDMEISDVVDRSLLDEL